MPSPISFPEFVGAVAGFTFAAAINYSQRKPMATGLMYKHFAFAAVGYFAGQTLERFNERRRKERVLAVEDYIRMHPEDFQEEERKTYGDVLLRWYPVR